MPVRFYFLIYFLNLLLGTFSIKNVTPTPENDLAKIKIKLRMNIHGIFNVSSASMVEKIAEVPEPEPESETMETDQAENKKSEGPEASVADGEAAEKVQTNTQFHSV